MNLALGVLIIFIIAIPGIVFRLTYLATPYSKKTVNTTATEEIFNSLFPAFVFHCLFILIIDNFGYQIDFQFIYNLLIGNAKAQNINDLNENLSHFLMYMSLNITVNFLAAIFFRSLVIKRGWDQKVKILKIYSDWYYKFKKPKNDKGKISVYLDLLIETKSESILYRGFLADFNVANNGALEELFLYDVRRRIFSNDTKKEEYLIAPNDEENNGSLVDQRYYYIPGDLFYVKYADVKNMNIWYFEESITE